MTATVVLTILFVYLFPAIVAIARKHHQRGAILMLDILLGWSVLGWIVAMVWACSAKRERLA